MKHLTATEVILKNELYWEERAADIQRLGKMQEALFEGLMTRLKLRGILHTMTRRRYGEKIHVFPQPATSYAPEWLDTMFRANGEVLCRVCRRSYNAHPNHPDYPEIPTLVVTCVGWAVKT